MMDWTRVANPSADRRYLAGWDGFSDVFRLPLEPSDVLSVHFYAGPSEFLHESRQAPCAPGTRRAALTSHSQEHPARLLGAWLRRIQLVPRRWLVIRGTRCE